MAKFTELSSTPFGGEGPQKGLCLDAVKSDVGFPCYALVWQGTATSSDGFIALPAMFNWEDLGKLFRKALKDKTLTTSNIHDFVSGLMNSEH